jgi:hypothetical protein
MLKWTPAASPPWLAIVAGILAGITTSSCYDAGVTSCHLRCGPTNACPTGFVCSGGFCGKNALSCTDASPPDDHDGGSDADAPADAPLESTPDAADGPGDTDGPGDIGDTGAPLCPPRYYQNVMTGKCLRAHDLNGDGKADALALWNNGIDALISDGSKFIFRRWFQADLSQAKRVNADDTTGDGLADAIAFQSDFVGAYPSAGDTFGAVQSFNVWLKPGLMGTYATQLGDVDGDDDHRADAIAVGVGGIRVALSTGLNFEPSTVWLAQDMSIYEGVYFADVDADDQADAIAVGKTSLDVYRSTGHSFGQRETWYTSRFPFFADVDGDGRADAVRIEMGVVWVALSDVSNTFRPEQRWYTGPAMAPDHRFLVDADGDGRADLVAMDHSEVKVALSTGAAFLAPTVWYEGQFGSDPIFGKGGVTFAPDPAGATGHGTGFVLMQLNIGNDIAAGGDGSVWALAPEVAADGGGYSIILWDPSHTFWTYDENGRSGAVGLAVDETGVPWAVKNDGTIFRKINNDPLCFGCGVWNFVDGARASAIGVGDDGSAWIVRKTSTPGGPISKWNGTTGWDPDMGGITTAIRIAVGPNGVPWAITSSGDLIRKDGNDPSAGAWSVLPVAGVTDIAIGRQGDVFCIAGGPDHFGLFYLDEHPGADASTAPRLNRIAGADAVPTGPSSRVAVGPQGEVYLLDENGDVYTSQM